MIGLIKVCWRLKKDGVGNLRDYRTRRIKVTTTVKYLEEVNNIDE